MYKKKSKFKAGMYLLETLTAGMYNEPLSIYREYIQNSVDSFEIVKKAKKKGPQLVKIEIDPTERSVTVYDNGAGIPADQAKKLSAALAAAKNKVIISEVSEVLAGWAAWLSAIEPSSRPRLLAKS